MKARILLGDMRETLKLLPDNSVDAIVTDPPYGLSFMGKGWDHSVPGPDYFKELLRVAKPGAHIVAFSGTRTGHRLACALEDAGWELRDCLAWIYGSGFPKSHNLTGTHKGWGTALKPAHEPIYLARKSAPIEEDLASQAELAREEVCKVVSFAQTGTPSFESLRTSGLLSIVSSLNDCLAGLSTHASMCTTETKSAMITDLRILRSYTSQLTRLITTKDPSPSAGLTSIAQTVAHLSSSVVAKCARLAPTTAGALAIDLRVESESVQAGAGREDIMFARKPFEGTVAANVLEHGTGAINVDACRIGTEGGTKGIPKDGTKTVSDYGTYTQTSVAQIDAGRWPANLCLDESAAAMLDEQTGILKSGSVKAGTINNAAPSVAFGTTKPMEMKPIVGSEGGASRFFYVAKASRSEREAGLEGLPGEPGARKCTHPTVKPIALMQWLCRLITPPGGIILDPFNGSGSTGCAAVSLGHRYIGCELNPEYVDISMARMRHWAK